jgi:hypothetical protein
MFDGGLDGLMVEADKPARMLIVNPYTRETIRHQETEAPAWIEVFSDSSAAGAQFLREATDRILQRKGRTARAEDIEDDLTAKAARLTTAWSLLSLNGEPINLPFSRAAARELFAKPGARWLRDQVLEFAADLGNYRQTTSPASSHMPNTNSGSTAA